jgi:hypothetical protein
MKNIKIEEVGDINSSYPYMEVFSQENPNPFLEVSVSSNKELQFKFYASKSDFNLDVRELELILSTAKEFLPRVLKNEEDFLNFK